MSNEENRASDDIEVEAAEVSVEEVPVNEAEVVSEDAAVEEKAAPEIDVEDLLAQLAAAKKEAAEASIRAQAEIQNVRRRVERDVESAHKFALEKFAGELLAVADSLERGLTSLDENDETIKVAREGNILTLKIFNDVLQKFKIEELDPVGEPFDPQFHEAMTMVPNPDAEPNSVMDVLQKGYTLNGRLIRPARVVVVKAP